MSNHYKQHLERIGNHKTFARKMGYINYNFKRFLRPGMRVLEIGPGMGEFLEALARQQVTDVDIIDNDTSIIENIKAQFKVGQVWNLSIGELGSMQIPLRDYDLIMASHVLEHVSKASFLDVLKKLVSALKPGGVFIAVLPNGGNPLNLVDTHGDYTHENFFTRNSLRQAVDLANISNVEVDIFGYRIPPSTPLNWLRIGAQKMLHGLLFSLLVINGGCFSMLLHPNICLVVRKKSD